MTISFLVKPNETRMPLPTSSATLIWEDQTLVEVDAVATCVRVEPEPINNRQVVTDSHSAFTGSHLYVTDSHLNIELVLSCVSFGT